MYYIIICGTYRLFTIYVIYINIYIVYPQYVATSVARATNSKTQCPTLEFGPRDSWEKG